MKNALLITFTLLSFYITNAQFSTGTVTLSNTSGLEMQASIETQPTEITLTLTGPRDRWFAIGFGGLGMSYVTDVFVYDGTGNYDKVGRPYDSPINDTNQDWTIVSETIIGSSLEVIATRPLSGSDSSDYTFTNDDTSIPIIWARGATSSTTLEYHGERSYTTLTRNAIANLNTMQTLQFAMYPNPIKTELNIVLPSNITTAKVEIYNVLGQQIENKTLNTTFNTLNTTKIDAGVYLIKVIGNKNTYGVKRFIKK